MTITGSTALWYTTRATGIVALVLLTGTVMLGVAGIARASSPRWPRVVTAGLHRNLALTATALVIVHVITTVLDPFASISLVAAFVPFSSDYRPLWLSSGAVAFDLLLAVMITSLLRERLNHRTWQAIHLLVYLSWPVALWHGLGTGTDTRLPWVLAIDIVCVAGVAWAIWWRLRMTENPAARAAGFLTLASVPLFSAVFVLLGPLQPGWAKRAGTPVALLGSKTTPEASPAAQPGVSQFANARFSGHVLVADGPGAGKRTLTITGHTTSGPAESFVIVLRGRPSGDGISMSDGTVRIGQVSADYTGPVVRLAGKQLVASVSGPAGKRRAEFALTINGSAATGTVSLLADGE
jgi:methionine sulfoxide reductase heme-binding subunit